MTITLEEMTFRLNDHVTDEGTSFDALLMDNGVLEVVCSNNEEFPIHLALTETQLLAVTPLFSMAEVKPDEVENLNKMLLQLAPAVPLSAFGLQGDTYILFGAIALGSGFDVIIHELEVQAENTIDVLDAIQSLLA
ncbi:MAG: YjfI family protein [Gammaproteobacteria bacterium]|nr:YjfI family protein [Gammaproteobacteria bacterium]